MAYPNNVCSAEPVPEAKTAVEAVVENLIQPVLLSLQTKHIIGNQNTTHVLFISIADSDPGSWIRCLFDRRVKKIKIRIRDPDGMNIPDHISDSLESLFWFKILKLFYADAHPDPGIFLTLDQRSGINIPDTQQCFSVFGIVASHLSAEGGDHVLSNTEVHRTPVLLRLKIRAFLFMR
jgi:hypothetical protein